MRHLLGSIALLGMLCSPAFAQDTDPELREMRLEWVGERQTAGAVLLGWGAANLVAGSLVAAIGYDEPALVGGGLISASFGLINGLLALTLFDLSGTLRAEAEAGRIGDATEREEVFRRVLSEQLRTGQTFAWNFGLDVAYITAGVLIFILGLEIDEPGVAGGGIAGAGQGLFLLGFDLLEWIAANGRADDLLEHASAQ